MQSSTTPRSTRRLIGLNIALLIGLAIVTLASTPRLFAQNQFGQNQPALRPRGEYTMVSGRYQGSTTSAVYILDAANQELVVLDWNRDKKRFEPIGMRRLTDDSQRYRGSR